MRAIPAAFGDSSQTPDLARSYHPTHKFSYSIFIYIFVNLNNFI